MLCRSMMFLAMVAPVAGCSVSTEPVDSLNVELAVEPATFRVGDTAVLQLTLSNPTLDTIRFRAAQCPVSFEVFDDSDSVVARLTQCGAGPVEVYLPGEQFPVQRPWHGESGLRDNVNPSPGEFLPQGAYTVRAVLTLLSGSGTRAAIRRRSERVGIRLLPPD